MAGGVSVVGMAQGAYIHGISAIWFQAGVWIAMFITAMLFEKIIQGRTTYSILDIVGSLYGRRTAQLAGLLQFVFMVWVITMNIVGGGAILSFILRDYLTFGQGMLLTAIVFTLYNAAGGFVATAYTNLIHIGVIIVGIFLGGIYMIVTTGALSRMAHTGHYLQPFGDLGAAQAISWAYISITLSILTQPVINAASSARGPTEGKIGIVTGNLIAIPVVVMAALCGIIAKDAFPHEPSLSALPALVQLLPPAIGVIFLIAMWAPLMSAGSPYLMAATTIAVKGYIAPILGITNDQEARSCIKVDHRWHRCCLPSPRLLCEGYSQGGYVSGSASQRGRLHRLFRMGHQKDFRSVGFRRPCRDPCHTGTLCRPRPPRTGSSDMAGDTVCVYRFVRRPLLFSDAADPGNLHFVQKIIDYGLGADFLMISTLHGLSRSTRSAVLPNRTCSSPLKPWLAITIRSMFDSFA